MTCRVWEAPPKGYLADNYDCEELEAHYRELEAFKKSEEKRKKEADKANKQQSIQEIYVRWQVARAQFKYLCALIYYFSKV